MAIEVGRLLRGAGQTVAVAESCTGGMLGSVLTSVSGSSDYFAGGVIAYANVAKSRLLGVPKNVLLRHGAVSAECAKAMAAGARRALHSDYAISVTGIAGPGGATAVKPVGLVYVGLAGAKICKAEKFIFSGSREGVRKQSCRAALDILLEELG